jgi:uncharacterized protein involved in outer membrane biogenesis
LRRTRLLALASALLGALLVVALGAIALLVTLDLRPIIERYASRALERDVTLAEFRVAWRDPLSIALKGLRLANAGWGSAPTMLSIEELAARIDPWSLLRGAPRFESLAVEKPTILLERGSGDARNWRLGGGARTRGPALVPKTRAEFPTLLDLALRGGVLIYRAPGSPDLRLDFDALTIRAAGDDQPVTLSVEGTLNGVPVRLDGETQSFAVLRNAAIPFAATLALATASARLDFKGTMTEPLDFEGVQGALAIDAGQLGDILRVFDPGAQSELPFSAAGAFAKTRDHWQLSETKGRLAGNTFDGALGLDEGGRGEPDHAMLALDFALLDLKRLVEGAGRPHAGKPRDLGTLSLVPDANPAVTVDARIATKRLAYESVLLADVKAKGGIGRGTIALDEVSFALAGGRVIASGEMQGGPAGSRTTASAALTAIDIGQFARSIDAQTDGIAGQLDGRLAFETTAVTLLDAFNAGQGQAVLAMRRGRIARALLERASVDLRTLFRKRAGSVDLICLLGVVELRGTLAMLLPLRLRTADSAVVSGGSVDLAARRLDLTLKAEGGAGGILALDLPLRISGDFAKPKIEPALGASTGWLDPPAADAPLRRLPPELHRFAETNACRG